MSHRSHVPSPGSAECTRSPAPPPGPAEAPGPQRDPATSLLADDGSHSLETFAECLELAIHLAHDFEHAHVAALTDPDGHVVEGTLLSDAAHTIDHAAGFALCLVLALASSHHQLTFFSVRADASAELRATDHACWRRIRDVFAGLVEVRDWIITDGIAIRSVAVSTGDTTAWPSPGHDAPPNTSTPPNRHTGDA